MVPRYSNDTQVVPRYNNDTRLVPRYYNRIILMFVVT
jgi:hypothetical protein